MKLLSNNLSLDKAAEIKEFSEWLLAVGDGKISEPNDGHALIDIPEELLISDVDDPIEAISREFYGHPDSLEESIKNYKFFQERAILRPKNTDVNTINDRMLDKLTTDEMVYLSVDSIDPSDSESAENLVYTPDFLNSIQLSDLPNHSIRLKIGAHVMLLRNIDPTGGLCNGSRLQIIKMALHVLEAKVIIGDIFLIPKVVIIPSDPKIPFRMRKRQFPLFVAFAMTINKSQGQSLKNVEIFLPNPIFSHGQLYVALSSITSKNGLKILIVDKNGKAQKQL